MRCVLFFLLFLAGASAHAQRELGTHDTIKTKTTVRVKVLGPGGHNSFEYHGKPVRTDSVDQAMKLNPLLVLRGEFPIYYEKRFSDRFSAEAGAGITFYDFIYETLNNGTPYRDKTVRNRSGFSIRLQPRYYPSAYDRAIAGFYMAPEFSYRIHRWDFLYDKGFVSDVYPCYRTMTELKFILGYQTADPYEPVFVDWFTGFGVRWLNEQRSVLDYGSQVSTSVTSGAMPVVTAGVKICFGL